MKYAAFLRGIGPSNPNMHQQKLCGVLESLGFTNVAAIISSGNVIFESPSKDTKALEAKIEAAWPKQLGFTSTTIIRSQTQLQKIVALDPFKGATHNQQSYLTVTFLKHPQKAPFKFPHHVPGQEYTIVGMVEGALFAQVNLTSTKTPNLMAWLEKQFGKDITTRTWKTVLKVLDKLE